MCIILKDKDPEKVNKLMYGLHLFAVGGSLGGVESLIYCPYQVMIHHMEPKKVIEIGFLPNLVRLSIGIEDKDDLARDILNSLDKL